MKKIKLSTLLITIITIIYAIISFYNLGAFQNPQTFTEFKYQGDNAIFELNDAQIFKIKLYNGVNAAKFNFYVSDDLADYNYIGSNTNEAVFLWDELSVVGKR